MKEAIANAGVFNLVIVFVIILLAFFVGSLGYSKAFKVKNRIIDEIEKNQGFSEITKDSVEKWLGSVGYRVGNSNRNMCGREEYNGINGVLESTNSKYQYCVYRFDTCSGNTNRKKCSIHYRVVSFMYFDVPVIGGLINIPVKGETINFTRMSN